MQIYHETFLYLRIYLFKGKSINLLQCVHAFKLTSVERLFLYINLMFVNEEKKFKGYDQAVSDKKSDSRE